MQISIIAISGLVFYLSFYYGFKATKVRQLNEIIKQLSNLKRGSFKFLKEKKHLNE